jgi:endonuclease-3
MVDKLTLGKKLMAHLKRRYHVPLPKQDRPVLETLIFAIFLENNSVEQAQENYDQLLAAFHDLNEIRVSSISELMQAFDGPSDAHWRAHRIRGVLQYVFEKHFEFAFEALRRKTLELAAKQLGKIRDLSPFVRNYTLNASLGTHVVPMDRLMTNAAVWLGLVNPGETPEQAAETLKSSVRKADVAAFCHELRCLAVDPLLVKSFEASNTAGAKAADPQTMIERLDALYKEAESAARRQKKSAPVRKSAGRPTDGRDRAASSKTARGESRGTASVRKKK